MHNRLIVENFKCFANPTDIELAKITVCVGMNSVGKSSVIQSMLLLRQVYDEAFKYKDSSISKFLINLNDVYGLQLGQAKNIMSSHDKNAICIGIDEMIFDLEICDNPYCLSLDFLYTFEEIRKKGGIFSDEFYYLNAERIGPRNYQEMMSSLNTCCGIHGENTYHAISEMYINKIEEARLFPDSSKKVNQLNKQIEYWMDYIVPGVELDFKENEDLRISQFHIRQQFFDTGFLSPYNFGFGISYVLPIIVTGLVAEKGSVLMVENPEAHLHPSGQSRIGYFLAMVAMSGVQIIIETHSEHVVNGIRIAALKEGMDCNYIGLNYFSINTETHEHKVESVKMNERMDIVNWPDGFFDQEEKDLRFLRELRR